MPSPLANALNVAWLWSNKICCMNLVRFKSYLGQVHTLHFLLDYLYESTTVKPTTK